MSKVFGCIYFTAHTQTVQGCVIVFPNVALVKVKECDERTIIWKDTKKFWLIMWYEAMEDGRE